ncbi:MAG: hypothetical protein JRJ65_19035, partial [Deltaproteobacteria bacterium]|nr:hypothetical protein [Deltaproteobacteria bacterium]
MNSSVNSKTIFCILSLCLITLSCSEDKIINRNQPKYTEHRQVVFPSDWAGEHIINPGEELTLPVNFASYNYPVKRSIRITGWGQYPGQYKNRSERNFRSFTRHIDDYLDPTVTYDEEYSLVFIGDGERIERNAYY